MTLTDAEIEKWSEDLYQEAKCSPAVVEAAVRDLLRRDREGREAEYNEEIDEFNAGYKAWENGVSIDDEPSDTKWDQWRVGWIWAQHCCGSALQEFKSTLKARMEGLIEYKDPARIEWVWFNKGVNDCIDLIDEVGG